MVSTFKQVLQLLVCSMPALSHPSLGNSRLKDVHNLDSQCSWHQLVGRVLAERVLVELVERVMIRNTPDSTQNHHLQCLRSPLQPKCSRTSGVLEWVFPHSNDRSTLSHHPQCSRNLAPRPNHTRRALLEEVWALEILHSSSHNTLNHHR